METNQHSTDNSGVGSRLVDLKVLAGYKVFFKKASENESTNKTDHLTLQSFISFVKNSMLFDFDFDHILSDQETKDAYELSTILEDLDVLYAIALLAKIAHSEHAKTNVLEDVIREGIILRILERFSNEIDYVENNKKYYVYALVDPTNNHKPFYIGKGKNKRVFEHFSLGLLLEEGFTHDEIDEAKKNKIEQLIGKKFTEEDIYRILAKNLTEGEAFCLESFLIRTVYGIENLTNKVMGQHSDRFRKNDTFDTLSLFDMYLVQKPSLKSSREHLSKDMIESGLHEPLEIIACDLQNYQFTSPKVLDAGELGIEANIDNIVMLKLYIRKKNIFIELRPRSKSQRDAVRRHFTNLGLENYLRNDLVYNPSVWLKQKTDDTKEVVRRAQLLIEFLKIQAKDELVKFAELFMNDSLGDINRLLWICNPENINAYKNESEFIKLTESIAINIAGWDGSGQYSSYIELSSEAIEANISNAQNIDLNTCVATLFCVHREQHFLNEEVIRPRIASGELLKLIKRINEIV